MAGIVAYIGLPRHGKTHTAVMDQAVPALFQGRRVVTNVPLIEEELRAWCEEKRGTFGEIVQISNDELAGDPEGTLAKCTPGSVVMIDELWRFLPAGLKTKDAPQCWKSLFAEFGHRVDEKGRMMQIVLITQSLEQLASFAYALVERTMLVTKLTAIGAPTRFRIASYSGAVKGLRPPIARRVSEEYAKYDKRVFKCYVSRTMSEADMDTTVNEKALDRRGTIWRKPWIRYAMPMALLAGIWGVWQVVGFFSGASVAKGEELETAGRRSPRGDAPLSGQRGRVAAVLRSSDISESKVLLQIGDRSVWVPMMAARCLDTALGGFTCEFRGVRYEVDYDYAARRREASGGGGVKGLRFGGDAVGASESLPDGAGAL